MITHLSDKETSQIKAQALREAAEAMYAPSQLGYQSLIARANLLDPPLPPEPTGDVLLRASNGDVYEPTAPDVVQPAWLGERRWYGPLDDGDNANWHTWADLVASSEGDIKVYRTGAAS